MYEKKEGTIARVKTRVKRRKIRPRDECGTKSRDASSFSWYVGINNNENNGEK